MDPAPAFSARGQRGGWTHRRKLYYEAFDELTRWAWREFKVVVARVPWEEASELHRSSLLAWQADFADQSYRHLRDIYPTSTTPSSPVVDINPSHSCNGRRPQLKARQGRLQLQHQLSLSNSQAPHQVHPPPQLCPQSRLQLQAQLRHRQQQGREIRLQLQAQRFQQEPALRAEVLIKEEEDTAGRRQPSPAPARKASTRRPRSRTAAPSAARSRTRSRSSPTPPARASLSSRPLILAPANCAYPTTRVDSTGIWILQHRYEGGSRPAHRAPHPVPSDEPYDLPDLYWHPPPRAGSSSNPPRGHGRAEHFDLSTSPPPERSAREVYSGSAAFNPDRVYEAEQVSIKRPAPAGRDSSTAPATKTARIVAPPQSVIDQAAGYRAASTAIPPPAKSTTCTPSTSA